MSTVLVSISESPPQIHPRQCYLIQKQSIGRGRFILMQI